MIVGLLRFGWHGPTALAAVIAEDKRREAMIDIRAAYFGDVLRAIACGMGMDKDAPHYLDLIRQMEAPRTEKRAENESAEEIRQKILNKL